MVLGHHPGDAPYVVGDGDEKRPGQVLFGGESAACGVVHLPETGGELYHIKGNYTISIFYAIFFSAAASLKFLKIVNEKAIFFQPTHSVSVLILESKIMTFQYMMIFHGF